MGGTEYTSGEEGSFTDSWWTYTDDVGVYRSDYVRGSISTNFSVSVNISLITDRGVLQLFVKNLTKSVPLDAEEIVSETFDFGLPSGGLLVVLVQSIQDGSFRVGDYYVRIEVLTDSQVLLSVLLPYLLLGILSLALSSLWREGRLSDYLARSRDQDYMEIAFTLLLSLLFLNPSEQIFPAEPRDIVGGFAGGLYASAWWIYLALSVSLYLSLQKRSVQNLWSYPSGKGRMYFWRMVELVKRVLSVSLQIFAYYFSIIYLDMSGRLLTTERMLQVAGIILYNALIAVQYALILGILFLMTRNMNLGPVVVLLTYYIVDYLGILPIRLSNLGKSDPDWWIALILSVMITGSVIILKRLYLSAEVVS